MIRMKKKILRLKKLIEHWAEHNDEHRARFEESAVEATEMELDAVVDNLKKAADRATEVSMYLRRALLEFK
jgi:hypothetical protein